MIACLWNLAAGTDDESPDGFYELKLKLLVGAGSDKLGSLLKSLNCSKLDGKIGCACKKP